MSNAQHFFNLAVRESDCPNSAHGVDGSAAIAMMGAIEQANVRSRDDFIRAGLSYLDSFEIQAAQVKEDFTQGDVSYEIEELCQVIDDWVRRLREVSLTEYFQLLVDDWDQRYAG